MFNFQLGVVVAIPRLPVKNELEVEVEISDPTVSCDVVAMIAVPPEFDVMMELAGNVPPRLERERQVEEMA